MTTSPRAELGELVDSILVTHGSIAFRADRSEVVEIGQTSLGLGNVVSDLELKRRHYILTPSHEALVLEEAVTTPEEPDLFTKSGWNGRLLHKVLK